MAVRSSLLVAIVVLLAGSFEIDSTSAQLLRRPVQIGGPNGVVMGGGYGFRAGGYNGVQFGAGQGARFGPSGTGVQFGGGQGARFGTGFQVGGGQGVRFGNESNINPQPPYVQPNYATPNNGQPTYNQPNRNNNLPTAESSKRDAAVSGQTPDIRQTPQMNSPKTLDANDSGLQTVLKTDNSDVAQTNHQQSIPDTSSNPNTNHPSTGTIQLQCSAESKRSLDYTINGTQFQLAPGNSISMTAGQVWNVGVSNKGATREIALEAAGTYIASYGADGWSIELANVNSAKDGKLESLQPSMPAAAVATPAPKVESPVRENSILEINESDEEKTEPESKAESKPESKNGASPKPPALPEGLKSFFDLGKKDGGK